MSRRSARHSIMTALRNETPDVGPSKYDLLRLVLFEYRSLVVRRLRILEEWRVLEWATQAECRDGTPPSLPVCTRCPVCEQCLAAAIANDDPAEWRGGVDRVGREHLWMDMEQIYREVRDVELVPLRQPHSEGQAVALKHSALGNSERQEK